MKAFTFIIRASGEATVQSLKIQLNNQITKNDTLEVLDDDICFEEKLRKGFELALKINNKFSVFIDGDILLRSNAVSRIRSISEKLDESYLGFGLKLWDRFYAQPKFRGLHVYKTSMLLSALEYIPISGEQLRPESYVKKVMASQGNIWCNNLSSYVAGIHDFYQKPTDIYYKFLIRSHRSKGDIEFLISCFESKQYVDNDFKIALKGLKDGLQFEEIKNNKFMYKNNSIQLNYSKNKFPKKTFFIDILIFLKLLQYYNVGKQLWRSL